MIRFTRMQAGMPALPFSDSVIEKIAMRFVSEFRNKAHSNFFLTPVVKISKIFPLTERAA